MISPAERTSLIIKHKAVICARNKTVENLARLRLYPVLNTIKHELNKWLTANKVKTIFGFYGRKQKNKYSREFKQKTNLKRFKIRILRKILSPLISRNYNKSERQLGKII